MTAGSGSWASTAHCFPPKSFFGGVLTALNFWMQSHRPARPGLHDPKSTVPLLLFFTFLIVPMFLRLFYAHVSRRRGGIMH